MHRGRHSVRDIFSVVTAVTSSLTVVGIFIAFLQLRTAGKNLKAQVLMRLAEDWRSPEIYIAVNYVNRLRAQWRKSPMEEWPDLATRWVSEHAGRSSRATGQEEVRLWDEWLMRRTASQFLAKMGTLMRQGYIKPDDLFGVIPEMGRLLIVLIPIEIAIREYWSNAESAPIAEWDRPVGKWEFRELFDQTQAGMRRVGNASTWMGGLEECPRFDGSAGGKMTGGVALIGHSHGGEAPPMHSKHLGRNCIISTGSRYLAPRDTVARRLSAVQRLSGISGM
jgi:hypothetical protein